VSLIPPKGDLRRVGNIGKERSEMAKPFAPLAKRRGAKERRLLKTGRGAGGSAFAPGVRRKGGAVKRVLPEGALKVCPG